MFRYTAAVAIALMLGAFAVTNANGERASVSGDATAGADSRDVVPVVGGGVELHACSGVSEDGPFTIVEFGRAAAHYTSGVQLTMDAASGDACSHLVIFTQPEPTQAL
jgi:hypothetical protein